MFDVLRYQAPAVPRMPPTIANSSPLLADTQSEAGPSIATVERVRAVTELLAQSGPGRHAANSRQTELLLDGTVAKSRCLPTPEAGARCVADPNRVKS
jgi:hypothetical protein